MQFRETRKETQTASVDSCWNVGVRAGIAGITGETIVLTEGGVVRAWTVKRVPEKDRWDAEFVTRLRGTLAQPNPNMSGQHIPIKITIQPQKTPFHINLYHDMSNPQNPEGST